MTTTTTTTTTTTDRPARLVDRLHSWPAAALAGAMMLAGLVGCADRAPPPLWPEPPPPTLAEPIGEPVLDEEPPPAVEPAGDAEPATPER